MTDPGTPGSPAAAPASDPVALLRSRSYLTLLVLAAVIGAPVSAIAYFYLKFVAEAQTFVFQTLPKDWMTSVPAWWPVLPLVLSGLIVGLVLRYLHGTGGHKPAEGFKTSGATAPIDLPGVFLASLATLCLGAVLGPEAPLIAIGSGLGVLAVHLIKKDAPEMAVVVIGAAGSFAAIATLLGSPIIGAFLLMEAAGLGGPLLGVVLVPGLLAAGIGTLDLRGTRCLVGLRHLLVEHRPDTAFRLSDRGRVSVGHRHRSGSRGPRGSHQARRSRIATRYRAPQGAADPRARSRGGRPRHRLLRDHRQAELLCALLRAERAPDPRAACCDLVGWCARRARALQRRRLQRLAERVPRRTRLSRHVHRGGVRDRRLAPARPSHDRRRRHRASGR